MIETRRTDTSNLMSSMSYRLPRHALSTQIDTCTHPLTATASPFIDKGIGYPGRVDLEGSAV